MNHLTLFDLDGTLLPIDSDHAFGQFLTSRGWVDVQTHARRNDAFFADYQAGCLDMHAYVDFCTAPWRDRSAQEIQSLSDDFMREVIAPQMFPSALELVERHRQRGDVMAIVTATNEFITAPICRAFGIDTLVATALERGPDGRFTGAILGEPNLREGKIINVSAWLHQQGLTLQSFETVTFYSDSTNDLPLLLQVSNPVATNPGPSLAEEAAARGWPVLNLFS